MPRSERRGNARRNNSNDIPETYASPNLRWALLLEDHPGAEYEFESKAGVDLGIPVGWGGDEEHCVCTITLPVSSGLAPIVAWKAVEPELVGTRYEGNHKVEYTKDRDSDLWNVICTKTLGRALKRAGYPDDMDELKALVVWRRRLAELEIARQPAGELPPANVEGEMAELEAAGKPDPDHVGADGGDRAEERQIERQYAPDDPERPFDGPPRDADADDDGVPPDDDLMTQLRDRVTRTTKVQGLQKRLREAAKLVGIDPFDPATASDADWVIEWVDRELQAADERADDGAA